MCLLITKPANVSVIKSEMKNAFWANPDGVGFVVAVNDGFLEYKYLEFEPFWKQYQVFQDYPMIIHFRYGTHGKAGLFNVHPFRVNEDLYFAHNGIIHDYGTCKTRSDTQVFNDEVLKPLSIGFQNSPDVMKLIAQIIGSGNKLAFMDKKGNFVRVNEKAGHFVDGIWYSNSSYKGGIIDKGGKTVSSANWWNAQYFEDEDETEELDFYGEGYSYSAYYSDSELFELGEFPETEWRQWGFESEIRARESVLEEGCSTWADWVDLMMEYIDSESEPIKCAL